MASSLKAIKESMTGKSSSSKGKTDEQRMDLCEILAELLKLKPKVAVEEKARITGLGDDCDENWKREAVALKDEEAFRQWLSFDSPMISSKDNILVVSDGSGNEFDAEPAKYAYCASKIREYLEYRGAFVVTYFIDPNGPNYMQFGTVTGMLRHLCSQLLEALGDCLDLSFMETETFPTEKIRNGDVKAMCQLLELMLQAQHQTAIGVRRPVVCIIDATRFGHGGHAEGFKFLVRTLNSLARKENELPKRGSYSFKILVISPQTGEWDAAGKVISVTITKHTLDGRKTVWQSEKDPLETLKVGLNHLLKYKPWANADPEREAFLEGGWMAEMQKPEAAGTSSDI